MKGAEAYVNDQWHSSGLARLPEGPQEHCVTLTFVIPRDAQTTGLLNHVSEVARQHLEKAYPGRTVTSRPVVGSVVGDGTGDGINLKFQIASASSN
ncbi:hypothetical protein [Stutzerimonas nitrititolerans]|uniref:hypothetical protein n=1 Tax=Stutzerimonas nitrititolerans TaxID=2482751 RepID=UPI0028B196A3|nr:hypothetical protein [Stutzerimonas nitrititolerans]